MIEVEKQRTLNELQNKGRAQKEKDEQKCHTEEEMRSNPPHDK